MRSEDTQSPVVDDTPAWLPDVIGPRWRDVERYAAERRITVRAAVAELISRGLSFSDYVD